MTIALRALKLLGLDVPARIHTARAALELRLEQTRTEIRQAARRAAIVAALVGVAVVAGLGLAAIALASLFLWVSDLYGVYAGFAVVAAVLVAVIAICAIVASMWSRPRAAVDADRQATRARTEQRPSPESEQVARVYTQQGPIVGEPDNDDAQIGNSTATTNFGTARRSAHATDLLTTASLLLGEYLTSPAVHPLLAEGLRHLRAAAQSPAVDPLDMAASVVREGDRKNMLAVLAGAAFVGWMIARRTRGHRA